MTLLKQTSLFTEEQSTSLQADSLVNPTQVRENEKENKMSAICGPKCLEQLEKFNHVSSWVKTFSALLIGQTDWYSTKCKLTWKLRGTKYGRMYFHLVALTHRTEGTGFGLLPTPESYDWNSARNPTLWVKDKKKYKEMGINLHCNLRQKAVLGMLPTPQASDWKGSAGPSKNWIGKSDLAVQAHEICQIEPGKTSQLNPLFVGEMMGFPLKWTALPFQNGEKNQ